MTGQRSWQPGEMSLAAGLRLAAQRRGDAVALVIVGAGDDTAFTYAEIDRRGSRLAARLAEQGGAGQRALLLMDSGIDYVCAFYACLYAGVIAVPVYPPDSASRQHIARLEGIASDADARLVLTTSVVIERVGCQLSELAPQARIVCVDVEDIARQDTTSFALFKSAPDEVAFLQYTSGSTGAPKGVMVSHGNLVANQQVLAAAWGTSSADVYVSWLPLYHDMGLIGALLQAVFTGLRLVLMSPRFFLEHPVRWLQAIDRHRATITGAPDSAYRLCADYIRPATVATLDLSSLRVAYSGSETVRANTLEAFARRFAPAGFEASAFFPCYGLAEATLMVSGAQRGTGAVVTRFHARRLAEGRVEPVAGVDKGQTLVACGGVPDRHAIRIVDVRNSEAASAQIGEIMVSGPSISAGYWNRADARSETWLRTGDLGFIHGGQLYIVARRKDLIIVRGRNLYPQDIEQAVEEGCNFVRKGRVAAFVAEIDDVEGIGLAVEVPPLQRKQLDPARIVDLLGRCVFEACGDAPSAIVLLNAGALPKTSSGKVQRDATRRDWCERTIDAYAIWELGCFLSLNGIAFPDKRTDARLGAVDEIGEVLTRCWRDVLGQEPVRHDAHFFGSGGSSLSAARLVAALGKDLGRPVEMGLVFEYPVFSQMAMALARLTREPVEATGPSRDDLVVPSKERNVISHAQQRQLFAAQLHPSSTAYHIAVRIRLRGALDREALTQSLSGLLIEHEILRTVFTDQAGHFVPTVQAIAPGALLQDLGNAPDANVGYSLEDAIDVITSQFAAASFDLARGPLIRFGLLSLDVEDAVLVVALHHIVADGWSMRLLIDAWVERYSALHEGRHDTAFRVGAFVYRDYAAWQARWLEGPQATRQLAYWSRKLADTLPSTELPFERVLIDKDTDFDAGRVSFDIPASTSNRIRRAASRAGTTPFVLTLAAWHAWLHRATGLADICVGLPVANRSDEATHEMIGFFANTLVMRSRWTPSTRVAAMVADLKTSVLDGLAHQELPFDVLVERLNPERHASGMPWIRTMFNQVSDDFPALRKLPGLDASHREILPAHAKVALAMDLRETGGHQMHGFLSFAHAAFADDAAERIVRQYLLILDRLVEALLDEDRGHGKRLGDLDLLADDEMAGLHCLGHGEVVPVDACVHHRFAMHAQAYPDCLAVVDGECRLTYGDLDHLAGRVAGWLHERGVGQRDRVAIVAERSAAFVIAVLGIMKAGASYVPFDPATPTTRIVQTLEECGTTWVLAERADIFAGQTVAHVVSIADILADQVSAIPSGSWPVHPDQPAYVIYTSGSTGAPKGVVATHASLANYVSSVLARLHPPKGASFGMVSTVAADLGHTVLFGALASGGALHLIGRDIVLDADRFAAYMADNRIDFLKIVPSHLAALLDAGHAADILPRRALVLGGETSRWDLIERIAVLAPACRIFNHYGPTEMTVGVVMHEATPGLRDHDAVTLPIGTPLSNQRVRILDEEMMPTATGMTGVLYLGGAGVAQGYLGRPGLTAERFVPDPFEPGARLYRSGDRARWLESGAIEYLGRADDQVKIRGHRVEPGEIAAQLREFTDIREAVVIAAAGSGLAAFVTVLGAAKPEIKVLRAWLAARLPAYMLPSVLLVLDRLPLNPNGKLDRSVLLQLAHGTVRATPEHGPVSQNETERRLAEIWAEVIGLTRPGAVNIRGEDNFFAVGGHSLAAMRVLSRIRSGWGVDLPLGVVLGAADLRTLAAIVDDRSQRAPVAVPAMISAQCSQEMPLSPLQQRIWIVDQLASGRLAAYNMAIGLSFEGRLDCVSLEASLERIVARHEILRAFFPARQDGLPSMRFAAERRVALVPVSVDLAPRQAWRDYVDDVLAEEMTEPFDLAVGPLMRIRLLRFDAGHHVLILSLHHIVADGGSIHILLREIGAGYLAVNSGKEPDLPVLTAQYSDYTLWRHAMMTQQRLADERTFWRAYLDGVPHRLSLPTDQPRPLALTQQGAAVHGVIDARIGARLRMLAARRRTTPFVVLLAAFQWFLHDLSAQDDLVVGIDVADRGRPEFDGLIGFFVNVLPVRSTIPASGTGGGFEAWLERTQRAAASVLDHRDLPFDRIVEAARVERRRDVNPLVQALLVWRDLPRSDLGIPGLSVETIRPPMSGSKFDLALFVEPQEDGYEVEWVYATALFTRPTVAGWCRQWIATLDHLVTGGPVMPQPAEGVVEG